MRINTLVIKNINFSLFYFVFLGLFTGAFAQCPTVTNPTQSFCDLEAPTISDLLPTNNGNSVVWYANATGGSPLLGTIGLVNGADYFVDNLSGTCGPRQSVVVTIYSAPVGLPFQGVCVDFSFNATISDLIATGNNVQWYAFPTGGSVLPPTTVLTDNTIYYASQTNPNTGCETSRLSVFVNVGVVPVPTGNPIQEFCNISGVSPTVGDLVASGNNRWYLTVSSASPLPLITPLIDGHTYYATTIDPPCESLTRFEVLVHLIQPNNPGSNGVKKICVSDVAPTLQFDLFEQLGGIPNNTGVWTGPLTTTNGFHGTVNASTLTIAGSPYVFTYTVSSTICPNATSTVTINIIPISNAGTNGTAILCSNSPFQNLLASLGGMPQAGGTWSPVLASGTGVFNPAVDTAGIYTYTVLGTVPCPNATATVTVTIIPKPIAGVSTTLSICGNSAGQNLFPLLGNTAQLGGTWSPVMASGTGFYNPAVDTAIVYTYTVLGTAPCVNATATVTITKILPPNAGTNGTAILCSNSPFQNLLASLGGMPVAGGTWSPVLASGTGVFNPSVDTAGIYTYTVLGTVPCPNATATVTVTIIPKPIAGVSATLSICGNSAGQNLFPLLGNTAQLGGTWSPAMASGTGFYNPALDLANVYTYTVLGTAPCVNATATVTITKILPPNAGTNGTATLCSNSPSQNLISSLGGMPQAGGTWSPALASGTGFFNPTVDTAGVYTYTVLGTAPCPNATATVTVTIIPKPIAGVSTTLSICGNSAAQNLFPLLGNTAQLGGTWSPAMASGTGFYNPALDLASVYTYTVLGTAPCVNATATVTITKILPPNAGTNGTATLCSNSPSQNLISYLGGMPQAGGTWSPALASGTGFFNPAVDTAGVYTYTVLGTAPCPNATATVTVTIIPKPIAGVSASLSICGNSAAQNLFPLLGNTAQLGGTWSPAMASGTGFYNPALDLASVYTYTVLGTAPCINATATVTITKILPPNAGTNGTAILCSNSPSQNLISSLGGMPVAGGTWSPVLASGTGVFNPTVDTAGVYTYTVLGTAPCPNATATVTVTIIPKPIAGVSASLSICGNSAAQNLFPLLGNTAQLGGTWSPAMASGTGFYNPAVDTANVYTYTVLGTAPCVNATATVTITKILPPNAGTNGTAILCSNSPSQNLFASLGGMPQAGGTWSPVLASGTGVFNPTVDTAGVYTYTVLGTAPCPNATATVTVTIIPKPIAGVSASLSICGNSAAQNLFPLLGNTAQLGGTWSPAMASGTGFYNPALDLASVYTYTVLGTAPCVNATATVTIEIKPIPDAGIDGIANLCSNQDPIDLITFLTGTPQAGGIWTPQLVSGTGVFNPAVDTAGIYTYTVNGIFPCVNDTSTVTITVTPGPDAGLPGSTAFCLNSSPQDLFLSLNGSPQIGGTWSPPMASGTGVFNPIVDLAGVYTYTFAGNQPCDDDTATVTVTINPIPDAGIDGIANLCSNQDSIDLFTFLTGTPQIGGVWTPTLASGTGMFNPAVDIAGNYTYTVGNPFCPPDSAIITVIITPGPDAGLDGSVVFCENSASQDLFLSLNGTPQLGGTWSPAMASGTGIYNPAVDTATIYTYSFVGTDPCDGDSAMVTVSEIPIPNTGTFTGIQSFCTSVGTVDLFSFLTGNQTGGNWTDSNNLTVTNSIDISTLTANNYSYNYTITNSCGTDTELVQFTILPNPVLNLPDITIVSPICNGGNETVTFSSMADGNYILNYELSGSNISSQSAPLSVVSGIGTLVINSFDIPNNGTTTITFLNIANASTSCGTLLADINISFNINPISNLEDSNLTIANSCLGSDATVVIAVASGLPDGNYQFNYTIPQATPSTGTTGIVSIIGGNGQFVIPSSILTIAGNYSLTINAIISLSAGCSNLNENATASFQVSPLPDANGANLSAVNSCLNYSNQILLSNALNLDDGSYTIDYQLSGANVASLTGTLIMIAGTGNFIIPSSNLTNSGIVTVTVSQIVSTITTCGTGLTFVASTSFEVTTIGNPVLITNGEQFCANENPTITDLSANIVGTNSVVWYNTQTGGIAFANTDLLIYGTIYYATLVSATGCESATRLAVTVVLNPISDPQIVINGNEFCAIDTPTIADLSGNIIGAGTVIWYSAVTGGSAYATTDLLIDGTSYFATLVTASGCESSNRLEVIVNITQLATPILIQNGNEFCNIVNPTIANLTSNISNAGTVLWYPASVGGTAFNSTDLLVNGTTYFGTLTSSTGCESETRLEVKVDLCPDIRIPDGFSPNEDGINETFEIKNLAQRFPKFRLEIYNRYGNILYKGNSNTPNWNGTTTENGIKFGDSKVPVGVYFYILEYNDGIKEPTQGRVYLSR